MQIRFAERAAVRRAGVRAAGNAGAEDENQKREAAALPQAGAVGEARGKRARGRDAFAGAGMSTSSQPVPENKAVLEKREGKVATLVLNRPERMNALNKDLAVGLNEALGRLETDQDVEVVVIAGAGRAFCAGGDLGVIGKGREENDLDRK